MKNLLKKTGLIIIVFSIVFMLGNCGGGSEGESEKAEGTKETANKKSTTSKDTEKSKETVNKESTTSKDTKKSTETITPTYKLEKGYYYKFGARIQIPVIINHTYFSERLGYTLQDIKVENIDKYSTVLHLNNIDSVKFDGNKFSGIYEKATGPINENNWDSWEGGMPIGTNIIIERCSGELSTDHKMIKYLELEYIQLYHHGERSGSYKSQKKRRFAILENIPVQFRCDKDITSKDFRYKHNPTCERYGVTRFLPEDREVLSSVTEADFINYEAKRNTKIQKDGNLLIITWEEQDENFVKVNLERFTDDYTGTFSFRQGKKIVDEEKAKKITKKVAVIVQQNENKDEWGGLMKGIGALMINDFMKIPDLKVLERTKIKELKGEIDLSQSGLVNPETVVRGDRMMTPDIEVIVTQENRIPAEMDLMFESFTVRTKIRIVETGQIIDPNLVLNINMKKMKLFWEDWSEYIKKVVDFTKNYLYE